MTPDIRSAVKIARLLGIAERNIQRILGDSGISAQGKGYPFEESMCAIVKHYKAKAEAVGDEEASVKARMKQIEMDSAEVDLRIKTKDLIDVEFANQLFAESNVAFREEIRKRKDFTPDQKKWICETLANQKIAKEI